jgi:hypothetical protein
VAAGGRAAGAMVGRAAEGCRVSPLWSTGENLPAILCERVAFETFVICTTSPYRERRSAVRLQVSWRDSRPLPGVSGSTIAPARTFQPRHASPRISSSRCKVKSRSACNEGLRLFCFHSAAVAGETPHQAANSSAKIGQPSYTIRHMMPLMRCLCS